MLPIDPEKHHWDVIIVGTGMGGATLGHALAEDGKHVLFCEQGFAASNPSINRGQYAESLFGTSPRSESERRKILLLSGRCADEIEDISCRRRREFVPFIGAGTGGSTAIFGMALERFFPCDFFPKSNYPDAQDADLPRSWPITYEDLRPYYETSEKLFRVRGTADPLRNEQIPTNYLKPPRFTEEAQELYHFLNRKGLHPYRLPVACDYVDTCECCQGYLCAKNCKNDGQKICLVPALERSNAHLLEECEVLRLEANHERVTGVVCNWRDRRIALHASIIVLAAGALKSPALLLHSANSYWPHGLANSSGLVGKNLMRHFIDLYVVKTKFRSRYSRMKELAFNDFYQVDGQKFGSVQSFGMIPPAPAITAPFALRISQFNSRAATTVFKTVHPIINNAVSKFFSGKLILASILEDLPYNDNQVTISRSASENRPRIQIQYRLKNYEKKRISQFRKRVRRALQPYRAFLLKQAQSNDRIAHACGTCRFGTDPKTSVLDPFNRVHDMENLYVVDASFFPSSGGINPALTIAANALRVADAIKDRV